MAEFEEQKKFWHIFYSPLVFIILLAVFVLMIQSTWKVYSHEKVSNRDRSRLETELVAVNQREMTLKNQVEVLQTAKGMEDEIRSKFNVTKEGEKVAVIINGTNTTSATTTPAVEKSWWQEFVGFFGE